MKKVAKRLTCALLASTMLFLTACSGTAQPSSNPGNDSDKPSAGTSGVKPMRVSSLSGSSA